MVPTKQKPGKRPSRHSGGLRRHFRQSARPRRHCLKAAERQSAVQSTSVLTRLSAELSDSCWFHWRIAGPPKARALDGAKEVGSGVSREVAVPLSQLIDLVNERFGTGFNQADQLFFDQIVEAPVGDDELRQAAAVNPEDKFDLVFRNLLERLSVERMDQNEEIFVRYMNDAPFRDVVSAWMASEAYRRLHTSTSHFDTGGDAVKWTPCGTNEEVRDLFSLTQEETQTLPSPANP
jgi:hypothetical protein